MPLTVRYNNVMITINLSLEAYSKSLATDNTLLQMQVRTKHCTAGVAVIVQCLPDFNRDISLHMALVDFY